MFAQIKRRLRRFLVDQIIFQINQESPEALVPLASQLRFALSIPGPLAKTSSPISGHCDHIEYTSIFLANSLPARHFSPNTCTLDLGCGQTPKNPFQAANIYGCDIRGSHDGSVREVDLFNEKIPFEDCFLDYVTAFDFIEHVPRVLNAGNNRVRFPFIELMNEIHRVLKPNGFFLAVTPAFPSREAFQDPTHVNFITDVTFEYYFCKNNQSGQPNASIYGFQGSFDLIAEVYYRSWLYTLIRKNESASR